MRSFLAILLFCASLSAQSADSAFLIAAAKRAKVSTAEFKSDICSIGEDPISARVFREYGAVFVATDSVAVPTKCVFENAKAIRDFHQKLKLSRAKFDEVEITLQTEAMRSLLTAFNEAEQPGLRITPLDGEIAGTRSYEDTVRLWDSRFYRALAHWERRGKISKADADAARSLTAFEQVPLVLNWERKGFWFSTGLNRSILSSVAAPGTSQHLSGIAFDVVEYSNSRVRAILNKNGWYQTVLADEPHFTYLGHAEADLPKMGLISKRKNGYKFWVPAIP